VFSRFISIVANGKRQNVKKTFAGSPRLWKRYVDDTLVTRKKSNLPEFFTYLNTIGSSTQFTMEQEKVKCLQFVEFLINRSSNRHLLPPV